MKTGSGKFTGGLAVNNEVWNECIKFIVNCIIYYNVFLLE